MYQQKLPYQANFLLFRKDLKSYRNSWRLLGVLNTIKIPFFVFQGILVIFLLTLYFPTARLAMSLAVARREESVLLYTVSAYIVLSTVVVLITDILMLVYSYYTAGTYYFMSYLISESLAFIITSIVALGSFSYSVSFIIMIVYSLVILVSSFSLGNSWKRLTSGYIQLFEPLIPILYFFFPIIPVLLLSVQLERDHGKLLNENTKERIINSLAKNISLEDISSFYGIPLAIVEYFAINLEQEIINKVEELPDTQGK